MTAEHHSGAVMPAETPGESDAGIRRRKKAAPGATVSAVRQYLRKRVVTAQNEVIRLVRLALGERR